MLYLIREHSIIKTDNEYSFHLKEKLSLESRRLKMKEH